MSCRTLDTLGFLVTFHSKDMKFYSKENLYALCKFVQEIMIIKSMY